MKKTVSIILAGMLIISTAGCSSTMTNSKSSQSHSSQNSAGSSDTAAKNTRTITGKVKAVSGNEIEIVLGEYVADGAGAGGGGSNSGSSRPSTNGEGGGSNSSSSRPSTNGEGGSNSNSSRPSTSGQAGGSNSGSTIKATAVTASPTQAMAGGMVEMPPMGEPPAGANGGNSSSRGSMSGGQGGQAGGEKVFKLSDKSETITVPINVPVTMTGNSNTLNFTQIMVKNIIEVTFEIADDMSETISLIKILS